MCYNRWNNGDVDIKGMEGVDKEKVQRVVYEMSKGSKYFQNEERKEAFIKQKVDNFRVQCAKLTQADLSHYQKVIYLLFSINTSNHQTQIYILIRQFLKWSEPISLFTLVSYRILFWLANIFICHYFFFCFENFKIICMKLMY